MKFVIINEVGLNATHFTSFEKEEAIKKMVADGITKDVKWAAKAYDIMKKEIEK